MSGMTPKQRWQAALAGQRPDRVPCDYCGTAEVTARLLTELGCASERELWQKLGIDKCIHLAPVHPAAREDTWHLQPQFSIWHIGTTMVNYGEGLGVHEERASSPLAHEAIKKGKTKRHGLHGLFLSAQQNGARLKLDKYWAQSVGGNMEYLRLVVRFARWPRSALVTLRARPHQAQLRAQSGKNSGSSMGASLSVASPRFRDPIPRKAA